MADAERNVSTADAAAKWFRKDVDAVQAAVLAVLQQHWPRVGTQIISHALIEATGSVLAAIVEAEPSAGPDIDQKLAAARLYVLTARQEPQ
jgi:hypothetical protein